MLDSSVISSALSRVTLSSVVSRFVVLRRVGGEWVGRCPIHEERTGSFYVNDDKGHFWCFGCGAHGNAIDILMHLQHMGFVEAVTYLNGGTDDFTPALEDQHRRAFSRTPEDSDGSRIRAARAMWQDAVPAPGTLAETYLRRRNITIPVPPSIRFAPALYRVETSRETSALIAAVQDSTGRICAVQRIWLTADGSKDEPLATAKKSRGPLRDGAVRLGLCGEVLGVAEGLETALAAQQIHGHTVWAALGGERMRKIALPPMVRRVVIYADNGEAGESLAEKASATYREQGIESVGQEVVVSPPEKCYKDWNDVLQGRVVA